jgi:site-specific DNA-methyltransferase (adenine-specific)
MHHVKGRETVLTQIVVQGNCLERMATIAPGSVSAIVTSPNYNLNKRYGVCNDKRPLAEYLADQARAAELCAKLLKPDGHFFLNVGWDSKNPMRAVEVMLEYAKHLRLQQPIVWTKSVAVDGRSLPPHLREMHDRQVGHFVSLTTDYFLNPTCEMVWHFSPSGKSPINRLAIGVPYVWKDQPERFGHKRELHCRGNTWHIPNETIQSKADRDFHPAPFPVGLVEFCLRLAALKPGDLVLDPFAGTGTTLLAAKRLGFAAIGIEIDPNYCEAARRRLANDEGNSDSE